MSWYYKSRVILFWLATTYLFMAFLWRDNVGTNTPKIEVSGSENIAGKYLPQHGNLTVVVKDEVSSELQEGDTSGNISWEHDIQKNRVLPFCNTSGITNIKLPVPRLQGYMHQSPIGMMLTLEPTNQLAICVVPKSSSTTWMNAFGKMNHIVKTQHETYLIVGSTQFSKHATTYEDMMELNELPQLKFMFVRHPFERVACYFNWALTPPKNPLQPNTFTMKALQALIDYETKFKNKPKHNAEQESWEEITFTRFVDYIIHEISTINDNDVISHLMAHWWPFTETCKVCLVTYDFVGHLERFDDDVKILADKFPENSVLQKMRNSERLACKSNCKGNNLGSRYMYYYKELKRETIEKLYLVYKNDFQFGGYDYPHEYIETGIA